MGQLLVIAHISADFSNLRWKILVVEDDLQLDGDAPRRSTPTLEPNIRLPSFEAYIPIWALKGAARNSDDFLVSEIFGGSLPGEGEGQVYLYLGDTATVVSVSDELSTLPSSFLTLQAYPNPFNPTTTIAYSVPGRTTVKLNVYNIRGELVQTLVDGVIEAGEQSFTFDGGRLSSGIYFVSLSSQIERKVTKILLLK